jgi:ornithine carbamoyltransferase
VLTSWVHAAGKLGFAVRVGCPPDLAPRDALLEWAAGNGAAVSVTSDPEAAARDADCVVTDTWVSMGQQEDTRRRKQLLAPYAVDAALMRKAARGAIFMHCLPAYRGNEVAAAVIDGPQSAVWDEAENRLHAQKAILAWCLGVD